MQKFTNMGDISISLAVWLATDTYDHDPRPNHISATSLIRPVRQVVLAKRVPPQQQVSDIGEFIASRMGTAIHDSIEKSWKSYAKDALLNLGISPRVANSVVVNPTPEQVEEGVIPVYMELRSEREVNGYVISGKFDFVAEGTLEDFKTTSVYTYINKTNDKKYREQGSIYRWLNPTIITEDSMNIQFLFTDWTSNKTFSDPNYPKSRVLKYPVSLMSVSETEIFVKSRIHEITKYMNAPEEEIPLCTDEDLWRKEDVYKYYKNPEKTARSTKNFDNYYDASAYAAIHGGIVKQVKGEVVACKYCKAFAACTQKDRLIASGDLIIASKV